MTERESAAIEAELAAIEAALEAEAIEEEAKHCRAKLSDFVRAGWHVLEPTTPLVDNWHIDAICDHVQAVLDDWIARQKWQIKYGALLEGTKRTKTEEPASVFQRGSGEGFNASRFLKAFLGSPPADIPPLAIPPEPVQRIQNLLVNVPPGTAKSRIVSVFTPAWMWLHWPSWRAIFLSANPVVALRDSTLCRDLMESDWYQSRFKPTWRLRNDQNAKSDYWNTAGGVRRSAGWFAKITGGRADALFVDDPHDADERSLSSQSLATVNQRWDSAIRNRVNDPQHSVRIGIMQRLAVNDWSGHVLAKGGWELLCLPQEFEPQRLKDAPDEPDYKKAEYRRVSKIGWSDKRTKAGELLFRARFPPEVLAEEKAALGSFGYAGQHQQRPAPLEGGIWKRHWWGYWVPSGITVPPVSVLLANGQRYEHRQRVLPARFEWQLQSWDMAFSKSETSSMVVGQVWALLGVERFLLDQVRRQMDFVETQNAFRNLSGDWPQVETKLVENKANGPAIISSLRDEFSGIVAVEPEGDKVARALAEQGTLESGHVWLPHPGLFAPGVLRQLETLHPALFVVLNRARREAAEKSASAKKSVAANWVEEFVEESATFPNGTFKDVVDTASQALLRMRKFIAQRDKDSNMPRSKTGRELFGHRA